MHCVDEDGETVGNLENIKVSILKNRIRPAMEYSKMLDALSDPKEALTSVQFTSPVGLGLSATIGGALGVFFLLHLQLVVWAVTYHNRIPCIVLLGAWGVYGCFLSFYHVAEFAVTMRYNASIASNRSFLLDQSKQYQIALLVSWIEFWIEFSLFGDLKCHVLVIMAGVLLVTMGQVFRSGAMIEAKNNFTHLIQVDKMKTHILVTTGVYSIVRHPSYFGWFWWSIGTQLILCNPICTILYAGAAWVFFKERIPFEEECLTKVRFFHFLVFRILSFQFSFSLMNILPIDQRNPQVYLY